MGLQNGPKRQTFDLGDLGFFDTGRDSELDSLCALATASARADKAVIVFSDSLTRVHRVKGYHSVRPNDLATMEVPYGGDVFDTVLAGSRMVRVEDSRQTCLPSFQSCEYSNTRALLATPIHGPAGEPIGALVVFNRDARVWSEDDDIRVKTIARCVSRTVLLRATMETLKLVSREGASTMRVAVH